MRSESATSQGSCVTGMIHPPVVRLGQMHPFVGKGLTTNSSDSWIDLAQEWRPSVGANPPALPRRFVSSAQKTYRRKRRNSPALEPLREVHRTLPRLQVRGAAAIQRAKSHMP